MHLDSEINISSGEMFSSFKFWAKNEDMLLDIFFNIHGMDLPWPEFMYKLYERDETVCLLFIDVHIVKLPCICIGLQMSFHIGFVSLQKIIYTIIENFL